MKTSNITTINSLIDQIDYLMGKSQNGAIFSLPKDDEPTKIINLNVETQTLVVIQTVDATENLRIKVFVYDSTDLSTLAKILVYAQDAADKYIGADILAPYTNSQTMYDWTFLKLYDHLMATDFYRNVKFDIASMNAILVHLGEAVFTENEFQAQWRKCIKSYPIKPSADRRFKKLFQAISLIATEALNKLGDERARRKSVQVTIKELQSKNKVHHELIVGVEKQLEEIEAKLTEVAYLKKMFEKIAGSENDPISPIVINEIGKVIDIDSLCDELYEWKWINKIHVRGLYAGRKETVSIRVAKNGASQSISFDILADLNEEELSFKNKIEGGIENMLAFKLLLSVSANCKRSL